MATQEEEEQTSFPEPTFGRAQRLTGFVATPPADWSSPMGVPLPTGARRHSWTTPTPNSGGASALPPSLSRQQSVAGNILVLTSTDSKTTTSAYLLQRKLEHMSNGYTVRVGYPLMVDANDGDDDTAMDDNDKTDNSNRVWEVQPDAPLVAIHIHPASSLALSSANTTLPEAVQYDPRAEWFVWQQPESNHSLLLTSLHGGFEDKTAKNDKDKSCYYSITPLHTSTVWDDLCQRKEPYSEEEARHVFLQILKCLERLQQMGLCHRNITLHNLLLINDNDDDNDTTTSSAMAMDRGQASGGKSNHSTTTGDSTSDARQQQAAAAKDGGDDDTTTKPKRLCLSRHGFALRVGGPPPNNDSSTPKLLPIPPPSTAQPLYVAPEWMTTTTNSTTSSTTTTTLVDPYAVDLWSATLCLLVLLIGAPNIASALYAAPVPADPRFVPVTQHVEAYFGNRLNLGWSQPLLDLLTHLLHPDPAQRLTLAQVQQHAWVTGQVEDDKDSSKPTARVANKNGAKRQRTDAEPDQKDNNNGGTAAMQS